MEANSGLTVLSTLVLRLVLRRKRVPGPHVAAHYSEETAAMENSRKDVKTVKSMSLELCGTDNPDIQHAHWQNTAEQFLSKFEKHVFVLQ